MKPQYVLVDEYVRDPVPVSLTTGSDWEFPTSTAETTSMERVYLEHVDVIYRFLYRRVGNSQDAEDLASETFLKASRQLDVGRSRASILSWLFTVARTVLADHWRRYYLYGAVLPFDDLLETPERTSAPGTEPEKETERWLAAALETLPPRYRRVLELRFLLGLSVKETAKELGVTPGNAKVLQHRALAQMAHSPQVDCCNV